MSRVVWGATAIGKVIDRTPKQVYYLVEKKRLKSIRKVGDLLVADDEQLLREITQGGIGGAA